MTELTFLGDICKYVKFASFRDESYDNLQFGEWVRSSVKNFQTQVFLNDSLKELWETFMCE